MTDAKTAWDQVGNRFAELASHVKEQFDARTSFGDNAGGPKIDDAVQTLVRALDSTFTAIGDTLRDPSTREEMKQAASAMGDAIATPFHELADQIKPRTGSPEPESDTPPPPES